MLMRSSQRVILSSKSTGFYNAGALDTYGLDAGYNLTPALRASVGYYYQNGDSGDADGSGVLGRIAYAINDGLTVGTNLSYDSAFKSRFSADIKWRFNTNSGSGKETSKTNAAVTALTSTPTNRDVKVHDDACDNGQMGLAAHNYCSAKHQRLIHDINALIQDLL